MQLFWKAYYHDGEGKLSGESLFQIGKDGKENKYADIDRFKLARFDLVTGGGDPKFSLYLRDGQRLIYRRRTLFNIAGNRQVIYLVGWQKTFYTDKGPQNEVSIAYIYEDGSVALDGTRDNLELLKEER